MVSVYKRPFWCEKGSERDIEMQFMFKWLDILKPKSVLDVGFAGSGYIDMILSLGIDYTGMDCNIDRITGKGLKIPDKSDTTMSKEHWEKTLRRISYICGDIVTYPAHPAFDLTMSISVIEHMIYGEYGKPNSDIGAVKNMKRTTKDYLMLTFPCGIEIRLPDRDILVYSRDRIKKIVDKWQIVDEKYYICNKVFKEVSSIEALSYLHTTRDVKSLCCLLLKR